MLAAARRGAVNVHGSLLPAYRTANAIPWAIINDERETGTTMHLMTEEIDAGPIIAQSSVPIHIDDTWITLSQRIARASETLVAEWLPAVLAGQAPARPQDEAEATAFRRRTPEDGRIDWTASALTIYNLVRALVAPLPGAFSEDDGARVIYDRYLTVGQTAALKYGPEGGQELTGGSIRLIPRPNAGAGVHDPLPLGAERRDGAAGSGNALVDELDWERRTARLRLPEAESDRGAIAALARRFVRDDLELELL